MSYAVKEMFLTLQGEGMQAGRRAVFIRFAGCNLWTGREEDRSKAVCQFCDTDFVGVDGDHGGRYEADALADQALSLWQGDGEPFTVITGGEPTLQLDEPLIAALKQRGFTIAVESNGTIAAPAGIDWLCISPKAGSEVVQRSGQR
jgi:Organic radical activating enzymes